MKMMFSHRGRQFFFITLTLKGRPAALSQLVDAESEPALLPPGEIALAILRAIHAVYPCVTLSNRVIMPDHIHFLLIVNYDLAPTFNPLWFSFVLIEAIEAAWATVEGVPSTSGVQMANGRGHAPAPPETRLAETAVRARARAAEYEREVTRYGETSSEVGERGCGGATPVRSSAQSATSSSPPKFSLPPSSSSLRFDRRVYIELSFDS